jgi:hypothetical protein
MICLVAVLTILAVPANAAVQVNDKTDIEVVGLGVDDLQRREERGPSLTWLARPVTSDVPIPDWATSHPSNNIQSHPIKRI